MSASHTIIERDAPKEREDAREERERRARVLEAAALEIEVRGWATGDGECPTGEVCLLGGIARAIGAEPTDCELWEEYAAHFGGPVFEPGRFSCRSLDETLYGWNDMTGRTAEEVTFVLRWRAQELRDGWDNTRRVAALNPSPPLLEEAK